MQMTDTDEGKKGRQMEKWANGITEIKKGDSGKIMTGKANFKDERKQGLSCGRRLQAKIEYVFRKETNSRDFRGNSQ